eukprot:TRINITY_DN61805_c0_g1_i1.p1 TRINITY_DN61805_c0_g1~~TRINITY_DN61805_c0_g1_i1.p1  ORF type:complete len:837 (-),score=98.94 TRINITY_DN61805_c0_g1_i1:287-2797(-)
MATRGASSSTSPQTTLRFWDPSATSVWYVPQPPSGGVPTQCWSAISTGTDGVWDIPLRVGDVGLPLATAEQGFAILVEWCQEVRHRGILTRHGLPLDEDGKPIGEPTLEVHSDLQGSSVTPTIDGTLSSDGTTELAQLLQNAEIAVFADIESSTPAAVGLKVIVKPGIIVESVEAIDADNCTVSAVFKCLVLDDFAERTPPALWSGVVPAGSLDEGSDVLLRVRKRDWRIHPFASGLKRNVSFDDETQPTLLAPISSGDAVGIITELSLFPSAVIAPPGPSVWSCCSVPQRAALPSFRRCGDRELVIYEIHVGSFSADGTFAEAARRLEHVKDLGCTAVCVMPVQQDLRRLQEEATNRWGYDVISFAAVDSTYGGLVEFVRFVERAHEIGLAVIIDYVVNHMVWGAEGLLGHHYFLADHDTDWGPRLNFSRPEVCNYAIDAAMFFLLELCVDGLRVDSTKSIRKLPDGAPDPAGAVFLSELASTCRRHGKLIVAEDLEDGEGVLQLGGLGFHLQWDMSLFCWVYDALVNPIDEYRDLSRVVKGLCGPSSSRGHALRGRVVYMECHDTATSDRYGRMPAAVHNGKAFMVMTGGRETATGDDFQRSSSELLTYPDPVEVDANPFAARRAAIGLVIMVTAPGVPMFLQGQEFCDSQPYKWPRGPMMDWQRVASGPASHGDLDGDRRPQRWFKFCQNLIRARGYRNVKSGGDLSTPPPLMGDGVHVFFCESGVMAYLRWAEGPNDSRSLAKCATELALVVVNCTNKAFPSFLLGVPPSVSWRLIISSAIVASTGDETSVAAQSNLETTIGVFSSTPNHGFPCSLDVPLQAYSAIILFQEA